MRGFTAFKRNEIINELNVDKSTHFKQVSTTFVPDCLKYVSMFSGKIFEADEFWCGKVTLWAKLFVYKQQFVNFSPDCSIRTVKCT